MVKTSLFWIWGSSGLFERGQQCEGGGAVDMRRVRVFLIIDERDRMANKYKQSDKNVAIIKKYAVIYDFNKLEFHCLLLGTWC